MRYGSHHSCAAFCYTTNNGSLLPQMSPTETTLQIHIGDDSTTSSQTHSLLKVKPYDLVLYNLVLTDSATYFCKAVQRNRMILLATWTLQVRQGVEEMEGCRY